MLHTSQARLQPKSAEDGGRKVGKPNPPTAPDSPRQASEPTALTQNDLRRPVVTRGDDGGMVFVVERGAAEVNEPHRAVVYPPLVALLKENGQLNPPLVAHDNKPTQTELPPPRSVHLSVCKKKKKKKS